MNNLWETLGNFLVQHLVTLVLTLVFLLSMLDNRERDVS